MSSRDHGELQDEIATLRARLAEAEETLRTIRAGEIDAIVVVGQDKPAVYTLKSAEKPYRSIVEQMSEGALTVSAEGLILYCNAAFARMLALPRERLTGTLLSRFLDDPSLPLLGNLLRQVSGSRQDMAFRVDGNVVPTRISSAPLTIEGTAVHCLIVTDLSRQELRTLHDAIVNTSADAIYAVTLDRKIASWNQAAERLYGYTAREAIGRDVQMLWPPHLQAEGDTLIPRVLREDIVELETVRITKSGTPVDVAMSLARLTSMEGTTKGVTCITRDITPRKAMEKALHAKSQQIESLVKNAPLGVAFFDREHRYLHINEELAAINGIPAAAHIGRGLEELLPAIAVAVGPVIERVFATGETVANFEVAGETPRQLGVRRHWLTGLYPVRDDDSGPVTMVGAWVAEITQLKRHEEQMIHLMNEVNHRAKNLLAVVQAIARQTAKGDPEGFTERLNQRIAALAASHDLLVRSNWQGVQIADLVRGQLAPWKELMDSRILTEGPPVRLIPAAAQALGMALHELATNAAKYGALSNSVGRVGIAWDVAGPNLTVRWSEQGGPPATPPVRRGFGHKVIVQMAEHSMQGKVHLDYPSSGVIWQLVASAAAVMESPVAGEAATGGIGGIGEFGGIGGIGGIGGRKRPEA